MTTFPLRPWVVWGALTAILAMVVSTTVPLALAFTRALLAVSGEPTPSSPAFEELLLGAAAVVVTLAAPWCWFVASLACLDASRGHAVRRRGCPPTLHRIIVLACGVAIVGAAASPSYAAAPDGYDVPGGTGGGGPSLSGPQAGALAGGTVALDPGDGSEPVDGLPLPDRPEDPQPENPQPENPQPENPVSAGSPTADTSTYVVEPGDSLWRIAAAQQRDTDVDEIWAATLELYADNRGVVGDDPDLIHPGQRLTLDLRETPEPPETQQ